MSKTLSQVIDDVFMSGSGRYEGSSGATPDAAGTTGTTAPAGTTDGTGTTEVTQTPSELDRLSETKYDINYDDTRFQQVQSDKSAALNEIDNVYQGMIDQSDSFYQAQIDASKQWAEQQSQLQQEKSDFAIDQIEQQKAQAQQDYTKEQSGAYVDWQKQSNQYGVNAEQMAAAGMTNTGYSESSQVAMYNTYQNRVATARESFQKAVLNYNNSITEARLHNNSLLAEIAYNSLQQQLELSLQGFQYKNNLLLEKAAQRLEVENMYYNRYQDVLAQINREIALAEQMRQYNESLAEDKRQFGILNPEKEKFGGGGSHYSGGSYSGGSYSGGSYKSGSSSSNKVTFDPNVDYQALIDDAIAKGNTDLAAKYEAQRNAKIDAMNKNGTNSGGYTKTNIYTGDGSLNNPGGTPDKPATPQTVNRDPYTYQDAKAILEKHGINTSGLMTENEWERKAADPAPQYSSNGIDAVWVDGPWDYQAYLKYYTDYMQSK